MMGIGYTNQPIGFTCQNPRRDMIQNASTDLKSRIVQLLVREIAPALEMDGSTIEVLDVTDGVVRLRLGGACGCCPSSVMTLIMGLEQELRKRVPEVEYLELVP